MAKKTDMTRYIGKIPGHQVADDQIKWLVVVPQFHNDKVVGYYINFHESLDQSAKYDNWYQSLEQAFEHGKDYGITKDDWMAMPSN